MFLLNGSILAYCFLLVILASIVQLLIQRRKNPLNKIPGPQIARWTNLRLKLAVITGQRMYYIHDLHQKYGPFVRVAPDEVSVSDPNAFSQIHKIGAGYNKSQWYTDLTLFERPTVFTMQDSKSHSARRKLLARAFSKTYLRTNWESDVRETIHLAVSKMKAECERTGSTDILKWWTLMATDIATHLMFGDSFHMTEKGQKDQYIKILEKALQGGGIGAELPLVRAIGKYLPFEICKTLFSSNAYLMGVAQLAVSNAEAGGEKNLFAHIIHEAEKGETLDHLDLKLEASGLIVAGSDTTAVTLTYLVWAVLSRPSLQHQIEDELARLPNDFVERDLEGLPILNSVIDETLRLYGAAPGGTPRIVPVGGATLGGYFLPGGTTVTTQTYTMHRDPNVFPKPYEFDHTRWLPADVGFKSGDDRSPNAELIRATYHPFGAGSRICLGIHLARMELLLASAEFFRTLKGAKLSLRTTSESMEMENFFLVSPKSHICEISY